MHMTLSSAADIYSNTVNISLEPLRNGHYLKLRDCDLFSKGNSSSFQGLGRLTFGSWQSAQKARTLTPCQDWR